MNTPAHLLLGAAAFGKQDAQRVTTAALVGSLLPDLSLYILTAVCVFIMGIPASVVFDELYFSDSWQAVFKVDNSFVVWGAFLALALASGKAWFIALCAAGLLHLGTDFPLHNDDARAHFWPITDWRYISPVSYWDTQHHARWVAPLELIMSVCLAVLLWIRHRVIWLRIFVLIMVGCELMSAGSWFFFM